MNNVKAIMLIISCGTGLLFAETPLKKIAVVVKDLKTAIQACDLQQVKKEFESLEGTVETPAELKQHLSDGLEYAQKALKALALKKSEQTLGWKIARITGGCISSLTGLAGGLAGLLFLVKPDYIKEHSKRQYSPVEMISTGVGCTVIGGGLIGLGGYLFWKAFKKEPSEKEAQEIVDYLEIELASRNEKKVFPT